MKILRTLRKLLLGETWLLPLGLAVVLLAGPLIIRPLAPHAWPHAGGPVLLAGVIFVLLTSVGRSARR